MQAKGDKVVGLFGQAPPDANGLRVNENLVELAEILLDRAKSGASVGVALVEIEPDGACHFAYSGEMIYRRVVGTLEALKIELLMKDRKEP